MNSFLGPARVTGIHKHFVPDGGESYWACSVRGVRDPEVLP